jgi:hypothetical protein
MYVKSCFRFVLPGSGRVLHHVSANWQEVLRLHEAQHLLKLPCRQFTTSCMSAVFTPLW